MSKSLTFSMELSVWDEKAFRRYAAKRAEEDGVADSFDAAAATLAECAQMIFDPGSLPGSGCDIEESAAEEYKDFG